MPMLEAQLPFTAILILQKFVPRMSSNIRCGCKSRPATRLTKALSKKLDNHKAAVALHLAYYNFSRIHGSLRVTPAMEAMLTNKVWSIRELLGV